ncbi:MAG: tripartite tricarboxylate transporter TctB family protein [Oscillospiraceae bacterium]
MIKKYGDVICGGVLMLVAVILFIATFSIRSLLGMNPGPDFMPKVASVLLFAVSFGILWEGLAKAKKYVPEEVDEQEVAYKKAGNRKVLYSIVLIGFYVFSMSSLGFIISTVIYQFCQMIILTPYGKRKKYLQYTIISIISTAIFYVGFVQILHLMLPSGLLRAIL